MNYYLRELCDLIADEGARHAFHYKDIFLEVMEETTGQHRSDKEANIVFKMFSFLNWAYANGIWSNLKNTTLRRDLMVQSMKSIVLRTSHELAEDKSNAGVAFLASELDQEFRQLALMYTKRTNELAEIGYEPDANTAILYGLEWIQEQLGLDDDQMDIIVPQFFTRAGDIAKIESVANQLNRAASAREAASQGSGPKDR